MHVAKDNGILRDEIHEVLGVVMMRFEAVAGNSYSTIRSLIVLLTICWLAEVRSLSTLA